MNHREASTEAQASLLASQIGYPIWAIWLGRRLRAGA